MELEKLAQAIDQSIADEMAKEQALIPIIREQSELRVFEAPLVRYPSGTAVRMSYFSFAEHLLNRAREVGAVNAIEEVQQFLACSSVPMLQVFVLGGVRLQKEIDLEYDVALVPLDDIPRNSSRDYFLQVHQPWRLTGSALTRLSFVPKEDYLQQGPSPKFSIDSTTPERMRITALLLALVLRSPIEQLGNWTQTANWIPLSNAGAIVQWHYTHVTAEKILTPRVGRYLRTLSSAYWSMEANDQRSLAISLARLNRSMSSIDSVDSAIDLGIALENFFMSGRDSTNQEITFTLTVRAARLLARSFERRTEIARLVRDLYKLRSEAVHAGRFATGTLRKINPKIRLREGETLVARALRKTILNGRLPDWQNVIFCA